ncbi:hypothetical protein J4466_04195 [Candidatus Pacearchaeota archaeon]|nr:hypothetical protein [Candidatus Pacearchaeota archaeon]
MKKNLVMILVASFLILASLSFASAITLTVTSPNDNGVYDSNKVLFDLKTNDKSDFYYILNNSEDSRWIKLCSKTKECIKRVRFSKDGKYNITIKAIIYNNLSDINYSSKTFTIDTNKPDLTIPAPKKSNRPGTQPKNHPILLPTSSKFINDSIEFKIKYNEENLEKVNLYYWINVNSAIKKNKSCLAGKNQNCSIKPLNLNQFNDKNIIYWVEIIDNALNSINSSIRNAEVDITLPSITSSSNLINNKKVTFIFEIVEKNFDGIFYKDMNSNKPIWKSLCKKIEAGRCSTTKSFSDGAHNLSINAVDKAGNSDTEDMEFTII